MKVIVIKNPNKSCDIVIPADEMFDPESRTRLDLNLQGVHFENDHEILDYIIQRTVPNGAEYRVTDKSNLPSSRLFRNSWHDEDHTETVNINFDKVRDTIRQKRNAALVLLDNKSVAESRKPNGNLTVINSKAQQLRDLPSSSDFMSSDIVKLEGLFNLIDSIIVI